MDSLVSTIVGMIFGSIGAGILWIVNKGKKPYKDILYNQTTASDVVGVVVIILIGILIYYSR